MSDDGRGERKKAWPWCGPSSLTIPSQIKNHNYNTWLACHLGSALITVACRWGYTVWGSVQYLWSSFLHFSVAFSQVTEKGVPRTLLKPKKKKKINENKRAHWRILWFFSLLVPYRNDVNNNDIHLNRVRPKLWKHSCSEVSAWKVLHKYKVMAAGLIFFRRESLPVWSLTF